MNKTLANHVIAVYDAMDSEAVEVEEARMYIGSLSVLIRSLASTTYYSEITRSLYDGGYAALVDRGGRSKPSTLILLRRPQLDELLLLTPEPGSPILSLLHRLDKLESKIGGVNAVKEFSKLDQRLQRIEERLEQHGKTS